MDQTPEETAKRSRFGDLFDRLSDLRAESMPSASDLDVNFSDGRQSRTGDKATTAISWPLRVAAGWSWRGLVVAAAAAATVWLGMQISMIVLPVAVALLVAVLLEPLMGWLMRLRLPRTLAAVIALLSALIFFFGLITQAAAELVRQFPSLMIKASAGLDQALEWLKSGPLALDNAALEQLLNSIQDELSSFLQTNSSLLASGALSVTSSLVSVVTGTLIMLFCLFFFLKDGSRLWVWVVRMFPEGARESVHESAIRGWVSLGNYARTQVKVAAIDALGIGLGAYFLGVPMAVPITVLVFFGSFIPIVGAFVSGTVAVLVAVVDQGLTTGLMMLLIILAVQQIEGNILQPWLMSNAVSLHPVAVLLVVAGAGSVAGIPGALFGVPIAAFLNSTALYLHGYDSLPALQTKKDRPGGPPGALAQMIDRSYLRAGVRPTAVAPLVDEVASATRSGETSGAGGGSDEGADISGSGKA